MVKRSIKSSLLLLVAIAISSVYIFSASCTCSKKVEAKNPEEAIRLFLMARQEGRWEEMADLISDYSINEQGYTRKMIKEIMKKDADYYGKRGWKLVDLKKLKEREAGEKIKLLKYEIRISPPNNNPEITVPHTYALVHENGSWKLNFNEFIKKRSFTNSCGDYEDITICIQDTTVFAEKVVLAAEISNSSQHTYSCEFGKCRIAISVGNTTWWYHYPDPNKAYSMEGDVAYNMEKLEEFHPGPLMKTYFVFGSSLRPVTISWIPAAFVIQGIKKKQDIMGGTITVALR